jgi:phthiocerol/phenolphthiocerol synthesis type-I polyketide synthase C
MAMKSPPSPAIAVVGYDARLPGAANADAAWEVMRDGRCTVSEVPQDRWSSLRFLDVTGESEGRSYTRAAGVLDDIWAFDPGWFGLSPREAEQMDPQQRILLDVTARAFERAGLDPARLDRDRTGVYVGASSSDHSTTALQDPRLIDSPYMLGNTASILANRISHLWDFHGPSLTVDTACSSGLFALDLAVQAIRSGRIDTAVVGGVHLLLSPMPFIGFSRAGMLSKRGLCRAFAADADGYVRSEGSVVFILQRADLARQSGLNIRSLVKATETNTAGHTSQIAIPSATRQAAMIRKVMAQHGVRPDDLVYAEAHGTGTAVGDPIEAQALGETYGAGRTSPLPIGSAKTNFGHLEPVAGLVGLLKAQKVLETGVIPASLFSDALNPDIDFDRLNLSVVRAAQVLPESARTRLVAVNSFGFGGANAHAVLAEPDPADRKPVPDVAMPPSLIVSAQSAAALEAMLTEWSDLAKAAAPDLGLTIANANWNRARASHRVALNAATPAILAEEIALVQTKEHPTAKPVTSGQRNAKVAFVFAGNGAVFDGMARHNFLTDPVFRDSFTALSERSTRLGGPDLTQLLMTPQTDETLARADIAQPLHFAVQLALTDALAAQGLTPSACLGHSLGEVAAAVTARRISRDEGLSIVLRRGLAFEPIKGTGSMAVLSASRADALALIAELGVPVDLAADNSPAQVTVSGPVAALEELLRHARKARVAGKLLRLPYPYHGRAVDQLQVALTSSLADIRGTSKGGCAFYSGWMGTKLDNGALDAAYWWQNARHSVEFQTACRALIADGYRLFLEISPHSIVRTYLRETIEQTGIPAEVHESLDKVKPTLRSAANIARRMLAAGANVDEAVLLGRRAPFATRPPCAPFERQSFRLTPIEGPDVFARATAHPLLGGRADATTPVWTSSLSVSRMPWLADHVVAGRILFPAAGIFEILRAAASEALQGPAELRDVEILRPIDLSAQSETAIRTRFDHSARRLTLEVVAPGGAAQIVAVARVFEGDGFGGDPLAPLGETSSAAPVYAALDALGLTYGPAFRRLRGVVATPKSVGLTLDGGTPDAVLGLDPTALDGAFHALAALLGASAMTVPLVPVRLARLSCTSAARISQGRMVLVSAQPEGVEVNLTLADETGAPVAELQGLRFRPLPATATRRHLYWREVTLPMPGQAEPVLPGLMSRIARKPDSAPSDHDVLRAALGARLALDVVSAALTTGAPDDRLQPALDWLVAQGVVTIGPDGQPEVTDKTRWPDFDTLITLLGRLPDGADDDLLASLAATRDAPLPKGANLRLQSAVWAALQNAPLPPHVLVLGPCSEALLAVLACDNRQVTLAAADSAVAEVLRLGLTGRPGVRCRALDDASLTGSFDLVLGIGITSDGLASEAQRIVQCLAPGGEVLLFEEEADLFAQMVRRKRSGDVLARLSESFSRAGVALSTTQLGESESLVALSGQRTGVIDISALPLDLSGAPALAATLRASPSFGGGETQIVEAQECLAQTFRELPDGKTVWIVSDDPSRFGELQGWRRTLANETGRDIRVLASAPGTVSDATGQRIARLIGTTDEREILIKDGKALMFRLLPCAPDVQLPGPNDALRIEAVHRTPALDGLRERVVPRRAPGPGEVEVEVVATGLNFRDVMWAQGLLPAEALEGGFAGVGIGMECAGRVVSAPPGSRFAVGDTVAAFAPQAFASHVTLSDRVVMALPAGTDLTRAAAAPVAFLTADYALRELARVQPGEVVLIHGAAGGVGLAALQIAHQLGARVIASAGSPAKRRYLNALGVSDVLDSRSALFEREVRRLTDGRGIDVVLNALAGEAMERGIACLAPFGRFVELGKRDIYANNLIGLRTFRDNISFLAVDADQLLCHRPDLAAQIMARVSKGLIAETLQPPPVSVFEATDVREAFLLMQRSGHIGKVVVRAPKLPGVPAARPVDLTGAWLITGGTSGFGLETARWLAKRGASAVWLVSRSGQVDAGEIASFGVPVKVHAADVTDASAMQSLADEIAASGHAFGGAVHAAASFDDAPFVQLDDARIAAVLNTKLRGGEILAEVLAPLKPRHLWFLSSVSARFGNPGQSAYVVANLGLEALALRLAATGVNANAFAFGPIADCGILARDPVLRDHLSKQLGGLLTADQALDGLGRALPKVRPGETLTLAPMEWSRLASLNVLKEPLFDGLSLDADATSAQDLAGLIAARGETAARAEVLAMVLAEAARILRTAPAGIDAKRPLAELGFDSLMAMSLKTALESRLGADIPMSGLSADLTPARLVHLMFAHLESPAADPTFDAMSRVYLTETDLTAEQQDVILSRAEKGQNR